MLIIGRISFHSHLLQFDGISFRLKIYAIDFDIEGLSAIRWIGLRRINDWLQISNNGEKLFGTRPAYTLLFDDIIEAPLVFKSDYANSKRPYNGFLLYFIGKQTIHFED